MGVVQSCSLLYMQSTFGPTHSQPTCATRHELRVPRLAKSNIKIPATPLGVVTASYGLDPPKEVP